MNVEHLLTSSAEITFVTDDGVPDSFGDATQTTTSQTFRCWMYQTGRAEDTANADSQFETWSLMLEAAAANVNGWDRVTVNGIEYELAGPPWPALNPRTQLTTHVECTVRRTR